MKVAIKGRFLKYRMYHDFAIFCSKLSDSSFCKELSKFQ